MIRHLSVTLLSLALMTHDGVAIAANSRVTPTRPSSITVVLDDNYPPYTFRDAQGHLQGILRDTWALWSKRSGVAVKLEAMDWSQAQSRMRAGQADVIDTLFITPERLKLYDFSAPYANIEVPIFFNQKISGITDAESLKGFTVGVKAGDACINHLQDHGISNLRAYPSYQALIQAAAANEVVVFCIDKPPAMYFLYKYGMAQSFRYTAPLYVGQFHWAVRKGNPALKQLLDQGFSRISDAERQTIQDKWLGIELKQGNRYLSFHLALEVLLTILVLLTLLALWNQSLRRRVASKTAEQAATLHYLSATLAAIPDLLFEMDLNGVYYDYRATNAELLVAPPDQLLNHSVTEVMPLAAAKTTLDALHQAARDGAAHGAQILLPLADGEHWFELSVAKKQVAAGSPARFIMLSRDITARKHAESAIERVAFFDPLTDLPNRRALHERLQQSLSTCRTEGSHAALLFIDIDNFKTLNDTRGHRTGDALLQKIANHMQACVRTGDCLGRFGGDEFLVIVQHLDSNLRQATNEAEAVAEKLLLSVRSPCQLDNFSYRPTASIGICLYCAADDVEADEILKRADMAMYRAKSNGRNAISFFDPELQTLQESRARMDSELHIALAEKQFELYLQVQIDQLNGPIGVEALLRWNHPQHGVVLPGQFISLAEETGLIIPIGYWVIERACALLQSWHAHAAFEGLTLAVNVSARQFQQVNFVHKVRQLLVKYQVKPGLLKFELTESLVIHNIDDSIAKMRLLRSLGIRLSLDDFGTGYASLAYLKRLPLDEIKIDRGFMQDIEQDHGNAIIVRTIIDMATHFAIDVMAEGVETEQQRDFLLQHGCTRYQGYLISQPVPLSAFERLLNT